MEFRTKKIIRNIFFLLSVPIIIAAFVYAQGASNNNICNGIYVQINNPDLKFVTQTGIKNLLISEGVEINQTPLKEINIQQLENKVRQNPWVSNAEIYVTANNFLNVRVQQKIPVVRVIHSDETGYSYYLDENAIPIMVSPSYTPRILLATTSKLGYTEKSNNLKKELVVLAKFIQQDTFWNAMITQININKNNKFELIAQLGNETILLGNTEHLEQKFNNLYLFYKQAIHTLDWNKYDILDAQFEGQIVCKQVESNINTSTLIGATNVNPVVQKASPKNTNNTKPTAHLTTLSKPIEKKVKINSQTKKGITQ